MYGKHQTTITCPTCGDDLDIQVEYVETGDFDPETYCKDTREVVELLNRYQCDCPGVSAATIATLWGDEVCSRWERQQEARMSG